MAKKREKCCQVWQRTERASFSVFRTFRIILAIKMFLIHVAKIITEIAKKREKCCQVWQRTERASFSVFRTFRNILAIKYILFLSRKL